MQKDINFNCPNCKSNKYKSKTTMGKKYNEGPYKDVVSEIQCSVCFMDVPANLSENININYFLFKSNNLSQKLIVLGL